MSQRSNRAGRTDPGEAMSARVLIVGLAILAAALFLVSLQLGPVSLSPRHRSGALAGQGDPVDVLIVRELRLPRAILALLIGATLALCGAALQGLVRNPLAAPSVFGAPSAAAFGAVLAIGTGLADTLSYSLPVAAMLAALFSVGALLALAGPSANMLTLLLAGLALSSLAGRRSRWRSISRPILMRRWKSPSGCSDRWRIAASAICRWRRRSCSLSWLLLLGMRGRLRVLTLGEDVARTSGVDLGRLRLITVLGVAMGVGGVGGGGGGDRLCRAGDAASGAPLCRTRSGARACSGDAGGKRAAAGGGLRRAADPLHGRDPHRRADLDHRCAVLHLAGAEAARSRSAARSGGAA